MDQRRRPAALARRARPRRRGSLLSTVVSAAVTAVIVGCAATAYLLERADAGDPDLAVLRPVPDTPAGEAAPPQQTSEVVTAPPLRPVLPLTRTGSATESAQPPQTQVLGALPACPNCGVVETVVAVLEHGQAQPRAFQMHIRMDDGSVRTVLHRGAFPAGSRVVVEGSKLRVSP
jgi:hypothetical protein